MSRQYIRSDLSAEEVRRALSYDPETGEFRWRTRRDGQIAGCLNAAGYRVIGVNGRLYRANRLAFCACSGDVPLPGMRVDHINRSPSDDRWLNLREATQSANMQNTARPPGKSGFRGVYPVPRSKKNPWRVQVNLDGEALHFGQYPTAEIAAAAFDAAGDGALWREGGHESLVGAALSVCAVSASRIP